MVFETDKFENILVECVESKNEHQLLYILDELRINPNKKLKCFDGLSMFEKILITPDSRKLIEICVYNGCDFYKKSADGIYPLRYAIDSNCADNLTTILKPCEESFTSLCDDPFFATQYSTIINEKFEERNNYLHLLVNKITEENYDELSKMIMTMLVNGCNINSPNESLETPFYLLLKNPLVNNNLMNLIIDNCRIDYYAYNSEEVRSIMEDRGLQIRMNPRKTYDVDTNYIEQHLDDWNELQLVENLEIWRNNSKEFNIESIQLLDIAVVKNLPETVKVLMAHGVNINEISESSKFQMTPAFLACRLGYHQVLKVLLSDKNLSFESRKLQRNLLHQIFSSETIDSSDRQKSFDLIVTDRRCTLEIINQTDSENRVPLLYACQYGCDEIVKELLRRGAYIGYKSVLDYIKKDTLEEFLDDCVKCSSDVNDRDSEIFIDYKFMIPPEKNKLEITSAHLIAANSNLKDFIVHPVIASFVFLKWRKIEFIVYINLLIYFAFMIFLGFIIVNFYNVTSDFKLDAQYCQITTNYHDELFEVKLGEYVFKSASTSFNNSDNTITHLLYDNLDAIKRVYSNANVDHSSHFSKWNDVQKDEVWKTRFRQHFAERSLSYWFGIFGLILMTAYEVVQCAMSYKNYFFKPINWLDILLIVFSFFVLIKNVDVGRDSFKQICAIMILLMGAQSIQLFSKVSAFSLSLHMAILNKVSRTFLKTIAPYLIIISSFGMSFFALNYDEVMNASDVNTAEDKGFSNPFLSTISTVRMMLSDFGAVTIRKGDHFQGILFLAFMISISIVLFNLLNALAISDTNEMMEVAEFVEIRKRISTLRSYATLYAFFRITYANIFPNVATIMLTPNKHSAIKVKQSVPMSDNVTILMQKTGKISSFGYLHTDCIFWKNQKEPLTFDEKLISKILNFVKNQQQKEIQDMDKTQNNKELYAIRVAQEDIYKELLRISSQSKTSLDDSNDSTC